MYYGPYSSWKFLYLFLNFFLQIIIIVTGEPMHTASKERNGVARPSYINHPLKSEVSITFRCQLCSTCYIAVRTKNCSKSTSAIKVATMKIQTISIMKGSHHVLPANRHFLLSAKMNGTQRRTLVSLWRMHCMYCGIPKGTCPAEATLNGEKIKPVALAIIELRFSEGSQSVSH